MMIKNNNSLLFSSPIIPAFSMSLLSSCSNPFCSKNSIIVLGSALGSTSVTLIFSVFFFSFEEPILFSYIYISIANKVF
ncbi:hypothetical protein DRF59_16325 [Chryseobacterium flavum]|uniref:Uncharacterized protein n=1 Tax=Chryseobacterium flavum TaxID=415851 RepID=A0A3D9CHU1_9FLAO|nr:hypothetical protein DRF59_16325 [Chryseobacterium flavum]